MCKIIKLGDVINLQNGYAFKSKEYSSDGHFVMRITNVQKGYISNHNPRYFRIKSPTNLEKFILKEKDILISLTGDVGRVGMIKKKNLPCILNQRVAKVNIIDESIINKNFLFLFLNSDVFIKEVEKNSHGTAQSNVATKDILNINLNLPPLKEQQRIVAKLDAVFNKIDDVKKNTELNLNNIKSFFQKYVDLVIDKGETKNISDVAELIDSLHTTPKKYLDKGYPMVRITDVKTGPLSFKKVKRVDKKTFEQFSKRHTPKIGDIIYSRVGASYGVSSYVINNQDFCLGQNTVFIVPKINPKFLYYFLNSKIAKSQYDSMVAGGAQPTISLKSIKKVALKVPEKKIQQEIVLKIDLILEYKDNIVKYYQGKINLLKNLREAVLINLLNSN